MNADFQDSIKTVMFFGFYLLNSASPFLKIFYDFPNNKKRFGVMELGVGAGLKPARTEWISE
jgi:hypothetical protein